MEEIKLNIGIEQHMRDGRLQDLTRPVEFTGEELAELTTFGEHKGSPSDTRGVTETLYRAEDGRLLVYVAEWSRWQGEANHYTLEQVEESDLETTGRFEALGREADFGRPLTLDEALGQQ